MIETMILLNTLTWRILGIGSLGLGVVGIFLPLLPTTPFVLLSAFAFSKGSPALAKWLEVHRFFGPIISDWRRTHSISPSTKLLACAMMGFSLLGCWLADFNIIVVFVQAIVLSACAVYILSRPNG